MIMQHLQNLSNKIKVIFSHKCIQGGYIPYNNYKHEICCAYTGRFHGITRGDYCLYQYIVIADSSELLEEEY